MSRIPASMARTRSRPVMNTNILIVEDDDALRRLLTYTLEREGYETLAAARGDEALQNVEDDCPDLLIVDWMVPGVSGVELCRRLRGRKKTRTIPLLMLTARGEERDRIRGLETGADDYVSKPFSMAELIARVRALLRRSFPGLDGHVLTAADISVDGTRMRVTRGSRNVALGPTEFRLLSLMIRRPGRVFSRDELLDRVWDRDADIDVRTVDVSIGRLRKALNAGSKSDPIRTVRSYGYAFDENYVSRSG